MRCSVGYEVIDEWCRGYNMIGRDDADRHYMISVGNYDIGRHGDDGIEVPRG